MILSLTHSTETPLPELPRPITDYAWFELRRCDARWALYGRIAEQSYKGEMIASYLPETESHVAQAVFRKLDDLHLLACKLMGVAPWMKG